MTQATESVEQALSSLHHLEAMVETGRRLRQAKSALKEFDARHTRVRYLLALEVSQLESEFDRMAEEARS